MNGLSDVPVLITDTRGELMHKVFDSSKLITLNGYLSQFCTLRMRGVSHDLPMIRTLGILILVYHILSMKMLF